MAKATVAIRSSYAVAAAFAAASSSSLAVKVVDGKKRESK
jgi:hypothetical protein